MRFHITAYALRVTALALAAHSAHNALFKDNVVECSRRAPGLKFALTRG